MSLRGEEFLARYGEFVDLAKLEGLNSRAERAVREKGNGASHQTGSQPDHLTARVARDVGDLDARLGPRPAVGAPTDEPELRKKAETEPGAPRNKSESDPSVGYVGYPPRRFSWEKPRPLPTGLTAVAAFDLRFLPGSIALWVADIADRMQCPLDFVAVPRPGRPRLCAGPEDWYAPEAQD